MQLLVSFLEIFSPAVSLYGDTGSTFLGYVLAVCSCIGVFKSYAILSLLLAVLSMALLFLIHPLL